MVEILISDHDLRQAGEGGDDVTRRTGDNCDDWGGSAGTFVTDDCAGVFCALKI